jgi:hypothetical protein
LAYLAQAENLFIQDGVIVPCYHYSVSYLFGPNVTGIGLDPREMFMFQSIKVAQ